jgi:serine/threonine-protein kinase
LKKLGNYDLVPHLLTYFEENLEFYLVQKFIEGHPLSAEMPAGYCWSEGRVFQLLQEVLKILHFIHHHGLIHRDVKPSNILRRDHDNRLVLIDFGAVKPTWNQLLSDTDQQNSISFIAGEQHATISIGTPGYMPNEQVRGRPHPSSDIYALGMIGIQALTGIHPTQLPEDNNTGEIIWQYKAQVSTQLASVLNKMVRHRLQDRYKSAKEALEDLMSLAHLYKSTTETQPLPLPPANNLAIPTPSSNPSININKVIQEETLVPELGNSINDNTIISVIYNKSVLLIGLGIGAISALALIALSYWSVQMINPTPRMQNFTIESSTKSR